MHSLLVLFYLDLGLRPGEVVGLTSQGIHRSGCFRARVHLGYAHQRHRTKRRKRIPPLDLSVFMAGRTSTNCFRPRVDTFDAALRKWGSSQESSAL